MSSLPKSLQMLIDQLSRFPGVGKKSAQRLAFFILKNPRDDAVALAKAIIEVKDRIGECGLCHNITENNPCNICTDPKRDHNTICIVEDAMDVLAIEKTGRYRGLYHVLGGVLSPLNGIGPNDLHIDDLMPRLKGVHEIIFAINPTRDGETTSLYLSKLLKDKGIRISRIAQGLPMGIDLEFADELTLTKALEGRTTLS
ncbi:MAG: recombination protein RecR [Candidatus Marinimicrobia bacterium]|nr:recombination protein RecR [Candidatus Neomarinimicrobiota bacterium]RKY58312.1 MAG: recombination protein RecR [Candidatus Neomarinimicrobiota bacterium]